MGADIKYGTQPAYTEIQKKVGSAADFLTAVDLAKQSAERFAGYAERLKLASAQVTKIVERAQKWNLKQGHVYQSLQGRIAPNDDMKEATSLLLGKPVEELFTPEALAGIRVRSGPRPVVREERSEVVQREERRRLEHDQVVAAIHSIAHGTVHGPGGLEGLTMAMMDGIGTDRGVARSISDGLHEIAVAIEDGMRAIALGMQGKYDG